GSTDQPIKNQLTWKSRSQYFSSFEIQVSTTPNFAHGTVIVDSVLTDSNLIIQNLLHSTTYYWHVNLHYLEMISSWSALGDFSTAQYTQATIAELQEVDTDSLLLADVLQESSPSRATLQYSPFLNDVIQTYGLVVVPPNVLTAPELPSPII